MTETEKVDLFIRTLNDLIEGAKTRVRDPEAFLAITDDIKALIETDLPPIVEALAAGEDADEAPVRLQAGLDALTELEAIGRARLVWTRDFEDYMRKALSGND